MLALDSLELFVRLKFKLNLKEVQLSLLFSFIIWCPVKGLPSEYRTCVGIIKLLYLFFVKIMAAAAAHSST